MNILFFEFLFSDVTFAVAPDYRVDDGKRPTTSKEHDTGDAPHDCASKHF